MVFSKFIEKCLDEKNEKELEKIEILQKYNNKCAYCGCELKYKDMQISHISKKKCLPACKQCHFYKSIFSLEEFRIWLHTGLLKTLREEVNYKLAIKYGVIKEIDQPHVFYFETIDTEDNQDEN